MRVGFRTIKTAIGVSISVLLAQSLQLDFYVSAGILTLLCIQRTIKQSYRVVLSRFIACMSGMFLSAALFELIGYRPYAFIVLFLLFIPYCVKLTIQEGIASSAVIIMHVYTHRKPEAAFFWNEFLVVVIGLGVALLVNWYMPNMAKRLDRYKAEADQLIASILKEYAAYLKNEYTLWDGNELLRLGDVLQRAIDMARLDEENLRRGSAAAGYRAFFEAKQKQVDLLERMLPSVSQMNAKIDQGIRLADFIEELAEYMRDARRQTAEAHDTLYGRLRGIRDYHKRLPLPESRSEFEHRANLFTVANELERLFNTI